MKKTAGYSRILRNRVYFNFSQAGGDTRLLKLLPIDETRTRVIKCYAPLLHQRLNFYQ